MINSAIGTLPEDGSSKELRNRTVLGAEIFDNRSSWKALRIWALTIAGSRCRCFPRV